MNFFHQLLHSLNFRGTVNTAEQLLLDINNNHNIFINTSNITDVFSQLSDYFTAENYQELLASNIRLHINHQVSIETLNTIKGKILENYMLLKCANKDSFASELSNVYILNYSSILANKTTIEIDTAKHTLQSILQLSRAAGIHIILVGEKDYITTDCLSLCAYCIDVTKKQVLYKDEVILDTSNMQSTGIKLGIVDCIVKEDGTTIVINTNTELPKPVHVKIVE